MLWKRSNDTGERHYTNAGPTTSLTVSAEADTVICGGLSSGGDGSATVRMCCVADGGVNDEDVFICWCLGVIDGRGFLQESMPQFDWKST